MKKLSRKDFKLFLEGLDKKYAGNPNNPHACPLCKYLKKQGANHVVMDIAFRKIDFGYWRSNPQWVKDFQVAAIAVSDGRNMRAKAALKVLKFVSS